MAGTVPAPAFAAVFAVASGDDVAVEAVVAEAGLLASAVVREAPVLAVVFVAVAAGFAAAVWVVEVVGAFDIDGVVAVGFDAVALAAAVDVARAAGDVVADSASVSTEVELSARVPLEAADLAAFFAIWLGWPIFLVALFARTVNFILLPFGEHRILRRWANSDCRSVVRSVSGRMHRKPATRRRPTSPESRSRRVPRTERFEFDVSIIKFRQHSVIQ